MKTYKIYSIEDNKNDRLSILKSLKELGKKDGNTYVPSFYIPTNDTTIDDIISEIKVIKPNLILCDLAWDAAEEDFFVSQIVSNEKCIKKPKVFNLLKSLDIERQFIPVIILTNYSEGIEQIFIEEFGNRADHIVFSKPKDSVQKAIFHKTIKMTIEAKDFTNTIFLHRENLENGSFIFSFSPRQIELYQELMIASKLLKSNFILLTGESGTGKSFFAKTIHLYNYGNSKKYRKIILSSNVDLIDSKLFGHKQGGYTGAEKDRKGLFEEMDGGTVFLDEITELSKEIQIKLFDFMDTGEFDRIGEDKKIKAKVNLIFATNKDINIEVAEGRFRFDLAQRIRSGNIQIEIPSLKEYSKKSILEMARNIFETSCKRNNFDAKKFNESRVIINYNWPGNFRQLNTLIDKYVKYLSIGQLITIKDLIEKEKDNYKENVTKIMSEEEFYKNISIQIFERMKSSSNHKVDDIFSDMLCNIYKMVLEQEGNKEQAGRYLGFKKETFRQRYMKC